MTGSDCRLLNTLEHYFADKLSLKELHLFEKDLVQNDELKKHFCFFLKFKAEIDDFGRYLFKEELRELERKLQNNKILDSG